MSKIKTESSPYFSKTIEATVTKFGAKVLCDNVLHNICNTITFTQGQGQKGQDQM